ncbi:MAG: ferrous iron transport protein B, partial [Chitinivibrionales bacterium]
VDIKEGVAKIDGEKITVIDLPGTYSLSAFSQEELVARNFLVEEKPDVVVDVVDATNLDRHLYLAVQLMEMGIRPVLALNMWDEVKSQGVTIDIKRLEALLGLTVVPTSARNGRGIDELIRKAVAQAKNKETEEKVFSVKMPKELQTCITTMEQELANSLAEKHSARWHAIKLFEADPDVEKSLCSHVNLKDICEKRDRCENQIIELLGDDPGSLIAESRYGFIAGVVKETVTPGRQHNVEISDHIDSVLTHRFWAYPVFIGFMWLLFQATFKIGESPMGWIESFFGWMQGLALSFLPAGVFRDLIVDGVIAGVGGVAVFLPNILILFFGISIMEDTGYMARAAFIMDRLMHRIGLHGKSFIPMIMGLGCSVPAIMAARTLESKNDRIKTILLTPLISCSARLPVFVLFAGALFPRHAGNIVFLFQVVFSFGAFILMALVFKKTLFRGDQEIPFVMELPPYRIPTGRSVLIHMWQKAQHYIKKMGGVVLIFSVILWWAGTYPKSPEIQSRYEKKIEAVKNVEQASAQQIQQRVQELEIERNAELMRQSYIGRFGRVIEPVVKPFGTDWRGAVSLVTGFVAKEVVVGSMGVLYGIGLEETEESAALQSKLQQSFTPLSAFSFMLFVLLYIPCVVALVTVIRELRSWKWSLFSVVYQLGLAWTAATAVYQVGRIVGLG